MRDEETDFPGIEEYTQQVGSFACRLPSGIDANIIWPGFLCELKDKTDNYNYNSWDDTVPDYPSDEEDTISNNYIPLDVVSTTISAGTLGYGTHALVPELDPGISLHLMLTSF